MNLLKSIQLGFAVLLVCLVTAGCETGENVGAGFSNTIKTQGVYTTLAVPDPGLDLPGQAYLSKYSFGPGETPAAVIVGYGDYNQQQLVTLNLIESGTGRSLFSKDYYATDGKALMQPLAIRLSGDYEVKLTAGKIALDSFRFSVTRTNNAGIKQFYPTNSTAAYAKDVFSASVQADREPDLFAGYIDKLNYWMINSVSEAIGKTNAELFAQRYAGKVVIQCRLDAQGHLTNPGILENTLDDDCARVILQALLKRSPYAGLPEEARRKLGSDYCDFKVSIYYD